MAIHGWGVFLILLLLVVLIGGGGYIAYTHYRARKLGLPAPSLNPFAKSRGSDTTYRAPAPAPKGVVGWVRDRIDGLRNKRTAGGAYENTGYGGAPAGGRRGFGPLDPDEAWDARVDNEASGYYEEQELGLQDPNHGPYGGSGYGNVGVGGIEQGRGRSVSRQRELDNRYEEEVHGGGATLNPFGDNAESSSIGLRSVSPRPAEDTSYHGTKGVVGTHRKQANSLGTADSADASPTERRSMFHENM